MQMILDFLPVAVWFVAYRLYGMYVATATIIVVMAAVIAFQWWRHGKVSNMLLISGILVAVLGGITLLYRNPVFFQWKLTVTDWLFAAAFLGSRYIGKRTLTERMLGQAVDLDTRVWRELNMIWVLNFFITGALNVYVLLNFDESTWANFKVFGSLGISLLTAVITFAWISWRVPDRSEDDAKGPQ
jgi:intracellular septation protein